LIEVQEIQSASSPLLSRLKQLKGDIEKDISLESINSRIQVYPMLMAVEIYLGYNVFFTIIQTWAKSVNEGIMLWTSVQMVIWGGIFSLSALSSFWVSKYIQPRLKNYWLYNLGVLLIFNIILVVFGGIAVIILHVIDSRVTLF
jgi:hypothetical protein